MVCLVGWCLELNVARRFSDRRRACLPTNSQRFAHAGDERFCLPANNTTAQGRPTRRGVCDAWARWPVFELGIRVLVLIPWRERVAPTGSLRSSLLAVTMRIESGCEEQEIGPSLRVYSL
jgi:hypothetical protein